MGMSGGSSSGSSQSNSYGYNQSLAQSINQAGATNQAQSTQNVWGGQAPYLQNLYGQASNLAAQQQQTVPGTAQGLVNSTMGGARQGMATMENIARGGSPLAQYAQPNNALARQQVEQMSADIGTNFRREILPGIRSGAGITGNAGGSRAALARGVAAGDAARAISTGATDLYAQQYGIGAQAAAGETDARMAAASALPGAASQIYNLGMMPSQAAWAPLTMASGIFGGPTVLGQSTSGGQSWSGAISQAQSMAENWAGSMSSQSGKNWGFNFF